MGRSTYDTERTPDVKLNTAQKKEAFRKMLPQLVYIVVIFMPFCYMLSITYDIWDPYKSLSRIGWRTEVGGPGGWVYLLMFVILSGPFMVYQVWFYLKHRVTKNQSKFLLILVIVAAVAMAVGAGIPFYHIDDPRATQVLHTLHNGFSMLGALLGVLTVTIIMIQVTRENKQAIILTVYALFCFCLFQVYMEIQNATGFEVGLVFIIFIAMYLINRIVLRRKMKAKLRAQQALEY